MKKILSLALPLIFSQLIGMALVLTDVWMMSRLSVADLAAGGLGASVYSFVFIIAGCIVGCVANLIAIAYGQSVARPEFGFQQIRYAIKGAVMLSVLLTLVLNASFVFVPDLLRQASQTQDVISIAMVYLGTLKWAMLPTLLLLVLRGLTSTFGDARSVLVMSIVTVLLNVPLSYLLAFKLDWGISGLGAGTSLSALFVLIGYSFWVFRRSTYYRFAPWLNLDEYSLKLMNPLLVMGMPIAIAGLLEHGLIYGGTLMAGVISVASLALHQILLQCLSFTWSINFGFSQAASILVGKDFGAGNHQGIKETVKKSFVIVSVLSAIIAAVFMAWPGVIAGFFQLNDPTASGDSDLTLMLSSLLWVVALCFVADAWQLLAINLLRGMKIVLMPTALTAVGYWVFGLPAAWLLMRDYGLAGIWGGIGIGLAATGVLLLFQLMMILKSKGDESDLGMATS
ncbi:MATE family efflux transporter [Vibrionales bacterium C3R12]|uniref:MATE family efflux transporter n=1 Tax=Vibrio cortegadensis TaxID=1328770 RepID=UPI000DE9C4AB|nr:MATE family efflux transporter [Vibrio cortegadensis]MDN3698228.1 MATE family efflux transporter [Vibrio cortegadensis]RBW65250.1 MATE family efflux transporter [Vibrionales bacterium C3R12]